TMVGCIHLPFATPVSEYGVVEITCIQAPVGGQAGVATRNARSQEPRPLGIRSLTPCASSSKIRNMKGILSTRPPTKRRYGAGHEVLYAPALPGHAEPRRAGHGCGGRRLAKSRPGVRILLADDPDGPLRTPSATPGRFLPPRCPRAQHGTAGRLVCH